MVYNFIWNNKRSKIKKTTLTKNIDDRGLKMADLNTYIKGLKLAWIRRFMTNNLTWECFTKPITKEMVFCIGSRLLKTKNPFWKGVFKLGMILMLI